MMKDEINSQVAFPQVKEIFTNAICCIKRLKNVKHKTSFGNSKHVKKILGLQDPPDPTAVFYCLHFALAL